MDYKKEIGAILSGITKLAPEEIENTVKIPKESVMGDYAFSCFRLSKDMRQAPANIAADLAANLTLTDAFEKVYADGPYLNFFVNKARYAESVVSEILRMGTAYGSRDYGTGKTIVIDYSSPNVTHEFHIGHLFSTVIGAALYRIYKFLGYNAVGINYIGDWGAQFGKLLYAYRAYSSPELLESGGLNELTRVYVKFHHEAKLNPELLNESRACFSKLEKGDADSVELWQRFCSICLESMEKTYKRLGVTFDSYRGESFYHDKMLPVVDELYAKDLITESDGAKIVNLEPYKMPVCLILRSDGGTLYPTRDIAAAMDRMEMYDFHLSLYVTDMRQSLHFAQFFKVIELMGYEWSKNLVHVPYGLLSLESGPLTSRAGNVILLEDLFNEAAKRALSIINEKNALLQNKESVAEDVGVGAVVFDALYTSRIKDLTFSWDKALNFEGETGPYAQYTHARANSVLVKSGVDIAEEFFTNPESFDFTLLTDNDAMELLRTLAAFPGKIKEAAEKYEPFVLSRSIIAVAQAFNKFYHDNPILNSSGELRRVRLALVKCVKDTLNAGLNLLGIKAPEQM